MDVTMGALLLAAFFSINLLSLVCLAMIAVGMAVPPHSRRLIWRFAVLPLLAALLIMQYSLYIGPPPLPDADTPSSGAGQERSPRVVGRLLLVTTAVGSLFDKGRHHDDPEEPSFKVPSTVAAPLAP